MEFMHCLDDNRYGNFHWFRQLFFKNQSRVIVLGRLYLIKDLEFSYFLPKHSTVCEFQQGQLPPEFNMHWSDDIQFRKSGNRLSAAQLLQTESRDKIAAIKKLLLQPFRHCQSLIGAQMANPSLCRHYRQQLPPEAFNNCTILNVNRFYVSFIKFIENSQMSGARSKVEHYHNCKQIEPDHTSIGWHNFVSAQNRNQNFFDKYLNIHICRELNPNLSSKSEIKTKMCCFQFVLYYKLIFTNIFRGKNIKR